MSTRVGGDTKFSFFRVLEISLSESLLIIGRSQYGLSSHQGWYQLIDVELYLNYCNILSGQDFSLIFLLLISLEVSPESIWL